VTTRCIFIRVSLPKKETSVFSSLLSTGKVLSSWLAVGRYPRATVDPQKQIENENDDEKDCSKDRASLKAVGRGSVRTGASRPTLNTHETHTNDRCGEGTSGSLLVRYSVMDLTLRSSGLCILQWFVCGG
jgi:hypothetical protein